VGIAGIVGIDSAEMPVPLPMPDMPVGSENEGCGSGTAGIDGCTATWGFAAVTAGGSADGVVAAGVLVGEGEGDVDVDDDVDVDVDDGVVEEEVVVAGTALPPGQ
jgi:hypothetical protein